MTYQPYTNTEAAIANPTTKFCTNEQQKSEEERRSAEVADSHVILKTTLLIKFARGRPSFWSCTHACKEYFGRIYA